MSRLILVFILSIGSVIFGILVGNFFRRKGPKQEKIVKTVSKKMKIGTIFFFNPLSILISFWTFSMNTSLIIYPFLGICLPLINGALSIFIVRKTKMDPSKAGSVFTSGTFSNIQSFGGLAAFIFFGADGYSLMMLFNIFISLVTYFIGYPVSESIGTGKRFTSIFNKESMKKQFYLFIPLITFFAGLILHFTGVKCPGFVTSFKSMIIPISTISLGIASGLTMKLSSSVSEKKEILVICLIKFVLSPISMCIICLIAGMHNVMNGLPFIIAVLASAMPVGFNALVPPVVYGFDIDLANSAWLVSTGVYMVVLSAMYFIFV